MPVPVGYKWKPIEDLPSDWEALRSTELRALSKVWEEQTQSLEEKEALRIFQERLHRQWAIETGVIERIYDLDRGVTQVLIEKGLDSSFIPHGKTNRDPELVMAMIRDHHAVIEGLFQFVKGQRPLSTSYVKELHAALTRHQETTTGVDSLERTTDVPLLRGDYKKQPNNPSRSDGSIHEYCPPEQVSSEMDRLIKMHLQHMQNGVSPEVEAAWLHHRFTQIHPFQDANGRVVRCLASLVLIKAGWFPLVITRDDRERYIQVLETADCGKMDELVHLFVAVQKRAFVSALGIAGEVLQRDQVSQVIDAVRVSLLRQQELLRKKWHLAKVTANKLQQLGFDRLREIQSELEAKIRGVERNYRFIVDGEPPDGSRGHYFRYQVIETARKLGYFADTRAHRAWTRLVLDTGSRAEILLSYHGIGHEYRGILAAVGIFFRRNDIGEDERDITEVTPLSDEIFQVNYAEPYAEAEKRFRAWLEGVMTRGLDLWRQGL